MRIVPSWIELTVHSTVVMRAFYDRSAHSLRLVYNNGAVWEYYEVTPDLVARLKSSVSVGSFINDKIKPHFHARCISESSHRWILNGEKQTLF